MHHAFSSINKGGSNEYDFIPPKYKSSRTKQSLPSLPQLELIPKFETMELENAKDFIGAPSYD